MNKNTEYYSFEFVTDTVDCGRPPDVPYASVDSKIREAKYTCDQGFELVGGSDTIRCQSNREWTTPNFECLGRCPLFDN